MKTINLILIAILASNSLYSGQPTSQMPSTKTLGNVALFAAGIGITAAAGYSYWRQRQEPKVLKRLKKIQYREPGYEFATDADRIAAAKKCLKKLSKAKISDITHTNLAATVETTAQGDLTDRPELREQHIKEIQHTVKSATNFNDIRASFSFDGCNYDPEDPKIQKTETILKFFVSLKNAQKEAHRPEISNHTIGKGLAIAAGICLTGIGLRGLSQNAFNRSAGLCALFGGLGIALYAGNQLDRLKNHNYHLSRIDHAIINRDNPERTSVIREAISHLSAQRVNGITRRKLHRYASNIDKDRREKHSQFQSADALSLDEIAKLEKAARPEYPDHYSSEPILYGDIFMRHYKRAQLEGQASPQKADFQIRAACASGLTVAAVGAAISLRSKKTK